MFCQMAVATWKSKMAIGIPQCDTLNCYVSIIRRALREQESKKAKTKALRKRLGLVEVNEIFGDLVSNYFSF
jgi:hypothetical protein